MAFQKKISRYTGMSTIAVWEQMYLYHSVVKPRRRL